MHRQGEPNRRYADLTRRGLVPLVVGWLLLAVIGCGDQHPLPPPTPLTTQTTSLIAADAYAAAERYTAAEAAYQRAAEATTTDPVPLLRLADLYLSWARPEAGLRALDRAVDRGASDAEVLPRRLELLIAAQAWDEVATTAQQVLDEKSGTAHEAMTLAHLHRHDCAAARSTAASWAGAASAGLRTQAILEGDVRRLAEVDPDLAAKADAADKRDLALGIVLIRQNDWAMAACVLERAVAATPTDATTHAWLGEALGRLGHTKAAEEHLTRATEFDPGVPLPWLLLGTHALTTGDLDEARRALIRAQELDPANPAPCLAIAELKAQRGRYSELKTWLEAALERAPEDPDIWKAVARFYLSRGLTESADPHAAGQRAVALAPDDAEAHALLGWSYLIEGKTGAALDALETALALDPDAAEATYLYAQALYAAGAPDDARAAEIRAADLGFR